MTEQPKDGGPAFPFAATDPSNVAQESHKPLGQILREEYDRLRAKDLSGVKHAVNAPSFTFAPAPKPVTWPDGVSQMVFGSMTISIIEGDVPVVFLDDVDGNHSPSVIRQNHHPSFIRQLAALLLAAADKVEGRG